MITIAELPFITTGPNSDYPSTRLRRRRGSGRGRGKARSIASAMQMTFDWTATTVASAPAPLRFSPRPRSPRPLRGSPFMVQVSPQIVPKPAETVEIGPVNSWLRKPAKKLGTNYSICQACGDVVALLDRLNCKKACTEVSIKDRGIKRTIYWCYDCVEDAAVEAKITQITETFGIAPKNDEDDEEEETARVLVNA